MLTDWSPKWELNTWATKSDSGLRRRRPLVALEKKKEKTMNSLSSEKKRREAICGEKKVVSSRHNLVEKSDEGSVRTREADDRMISQVEVGPQRHNSSHRRQCVTVSHTNLVLSCLRVEGGYLLFTKGLLSPLSNRYSSVLSLLLCHVWWSSQGERVQEFLVKRESLVNWSDNWQCFLYQRYYVSLSMFLLYK